MSTKENDVVNPLSESVSVSAKPRSWIKRGCLFTLGTFVLLVVLIYRFLPGVIDLMLLPEHNTEASRWVLWHGGHVFSKARPYSMRNDAMVRSVMLHKSLSLTDSEGLWNLKPMVSLESIWLHDRHLGPGLDALQELSRLNLIIHQPGPGRLRELNRVLGIVKLDVRDPQTADSGQAALADLQQLKDLWLCDCSNPGPWLEQLPELPNVHVLFLSECTGWTNNDLKALRHLPHIKQLNFFSDQQESLDDEGLEYLLASPDLEKLQLRMNWNAVTDKGFAAMKTHPSLKWVIVFESDCTSERIARLRAALPPECKLSLF